jgi:hypothetical protein
MEKDGKKFISEPLLFEEKGACEDFRLLFSQHIGAFISEIGEIEITV